MENRFLAPTAARRPLLARGKSRSFSRATSAYSGAFSADQRALVILIENGGIDLAIPELVDKLLSNVPGASLIPEDVRQKLIVFVRDTIKGLTDTLIESADLALNRYQDAAPSMFGSVTVLRNSTATYDDLKNKLIGLSKEGKIIDLFILTHGADKRIAVTGDVTDDKIRQMRAEFGKPLSIRAVYMMNCVGSSLNQAWLDAGAKTSAGALHNNYLPEPTNFFFWQNWKDGQSFEAAVNAAYRKTINLMNDAVNGFIKALGLSGLASVDFEQMDFVKDSAPVISGQRTVTVGTDDLTFAQSLSSSLATTVLPMSLLRTLGNGGGHTGKVVSHSFSYHSPSTMMRKRGEFSKQQNPVAAIIAGIEVADAIQIGLGAAAIVQTQVNGSSGSFQLVYSTAQRLLTPEARREMPGSMPSKKKYSTRFLYLGARNLVMDLAHAEVIIEWEGNPYGEIGTPVFRRELHASSDWSKSSASITVQKLERIPEPGRDPRAWPIVYGYEGSYDPVGNGHWEFSGEIEINAFGGLRFVRHEVESRSLLNAVLADKNEYVVRGDAVDAPVAVVPAEQVQWLKKNALPAP